MGSITIEDGGQYHQGGRGEGRGGALVPLVTNLEHAKPYDYIESISWRGAIRYCLKYVDNLLSCLKPL